MTRTDHGYNQEVICRQVSGTLPGANGLALGDGRLFVGDVENGTMTIYDIQPDKSLQQIQQVVSSGHRYQTSHLLTYESGPRCCSGQYQDHPHNRRPSRYRSASSCFPRVRRSLLISIQLTFISLPDPHKDRCLPRQRPFIRKGLFSPCCSASTGPYQGLQARTDLQGRWLGTELHDRARHRSDEQHPCWGRGLAVWWLRCLQAPC